VIDTIEVKGHTICLSRHALERYRDRCFPGLAIATLAALQSLDCRVVLISSLGASTYGANQPDATWLDMENTLCREGDLSYRSELVTPGAEADRGEGLLEEGMPIMRAAADRNGYELFLPTSLSESISVKVALLQRNKIDLLVNIGGSEASIGACPHAVTIPNGFHDKYRPCTCADRGIIAHLAGQGIPFIHLLYVRDLAVRYGVSLEAPPSGHGGEQLYLTRRAHPVMVAANLVIVAGLLVVYRRLNLRS